MVIKPSFALGVFMLVLPSGTAIGMEGQFTLNKGIGMAMALSFLLNIMLTRPKLKINKKALWIVSAYFGWSCFAIIANSGPLILSQLFTKVQYIAFFLIVYWILETNKEKNFLWIIRSFVAGTCGTVILAFATGVAIQAVEENVYEGRFAATAGGIMNANSLAAILGLALFSSIYLIVKDKKIILRVIYIGCILFLGFILFKTGSRGALLAVIFTFLAVSFGRQLVRSPGLVLGVLAVLAVFLATGYFLLKTGRLQADVAERLTDVYRAQESIANRMLYNKAALKVATERLTGGGYFTWFMYANVDHFPHNDLLYSTGLYGFPAGLLFIAFIVSMMLTVKRIPMKLERFYAKAILIFLILIGLKGMYVSEKFYWVFWAIVMVCEKFGASSEEQQYIQLEQSGGEFSVEEQL
jgi:O-antigen ligase